MQATISGIHMQENNDDDQAKKMNTGVCWEDSDFRRIGLYPKVLSLNEAADDEVFRRKTHVFHDCIKDWKDEDMDSKGCTILEQRILTKYDTPKWVNPDHGQWAGIYSASRQDTISEEEECLQLQVVWNFVGM